MQIIRKGVELHALIDDWKAAGDSVAWVPTMGNLHAGHLSLVESAKRLAGRTVVSLFVNPFQFGPQEDFAAYPRTPEDDILKLDQAGVDLLFMPEASDVYPRAPEQMTFVEVPDLSHDLCGRFRPGHFRGVATVVLKLFNRIQPHWAVFGAKDYQQWLIVNRMVSELDLPLKLHLVATQREPDGLALSSRNAYLSAGEKARASQLYRCLQAAAGELEAGETDYRAIEDRQTDRLTAFGFEVDYFSVRQADDLSMPQPDARRLVILVAARLGKTRLIDNLIKG
jgi:pantoate--beta-alanine ligase